MASKRRGRSCGRPIGMIEQQMAARRLGDGRSSSASPIAPRRRRCSTATWSVPFGDDHKNVAAYFERLKARPSVARVLKEAEPYFNMVPK